MSDSKAAGTAGGISERSQEMLDSGHLAQTWDWLLIFEKAAPKVQVLEAMYVRGR